ncbi:MAG: hypothetical protein Q7S64_02065 [bacterium]|nr:hypothetical protein [bacterium]
MKIQTKEGWLASLTLALLAVLAVTKTVFAQADANIFGNGLTDSTKYGSSAAGIISSFFYKSLVVLLWIISAAAVLNLIYAGFQFITAGGDSTKSEQAKKNIIYTVVGIIIAISMALIYNATKKIGLGLH